MPFGKKFVCLDLKNLAQIGKTDNMGQIHRPTTFKVMLGSLGHINVLRLGFGKCSEAQDCVGLGFMPFEKFVRSGRPFDMHRKNDFTKEKTKVRPWLSIEI